jgi:hypothetical protein
MGHRLAIGFVLAAFTLAGCGGDDDAAEEPLGTASTATLASTAAPTTVVATTSPSSSTEPRCRASHKTMEVAQEAYRAMHGAETNPTEADLIPDFIRNAFGVYDIVDGAIVPAPDGPCVGVDIDF